jgi:hypothetical protein
VFISGVVNNAALQQIRTAQLAAFHRIMALSPQSFITNAPTLLPKQ